MNIQEALRRHETRLMAKPNVTGVGIGEKDGCPVIKVFVTRKVEAATLGPHELVPPRVDEYDTDVEEIGIVTAAVD